jgi:hypothetical protein
MIVRRVVSTDDYCSYPRRARAESSSTTCTQDRYWILGYVNELTLDCRAYIHTVQCNTYAKTRWKERVDGTTYLHFHQLQEQGALLHRIGCTCLASTPFRSLMRSPLGKTSIVTVVMPMPREIPLDVDGDRCGAGVTGSKGNNMSVDRLGSAREGAEETKKKKNNQRARLICCRHALAAVSSRFLETRTIASAHHGMIEEEGREGRD